MKFSTVNGVMIHVMFHTYGSGAVQIGASINRNNPNGKTGFVSQLKDPLQRPRLYFDKLSLGNMRDI